MAAPRKNAAPKAATSAARRRPARRGPKVSYETKGWRFARLMRTLMVLVEAERPLTPQEVNERVCGEGAFSASLGRIATTRHDLWTLARGCGFPLMLVDAAGGAVDMERLQSLGERRGALKNVRWELRAGEEFPGVERPVSGADLAGLALLRATAGSAGRGTFPTLRLLGRMVDAVQSDGGRVGVPSPLPLAAPTAGKEAAKRKRKADDKPGKKAKASKDVGSRKPSAGKGASAKPAAESEAVPTAMPVMGLLADAIARRSVVEVAWSKGEGKKVRRELLAPLHLGPAGEKRRVVVADAESGTLSRLRVDRIVSVRFVAGRPAPKVKRKALEEMIAGLAGD